MKSILIVDDDVYIGNMVEEVLQKSGYRAARALTEQLHGRISASYEDGCLNIRLYFPERPSV